MPCLQGGSVGNEQLEVVEDVSLVWTRAKVQVSFIQPVLSDGGRVLPACRGGLPVALELVTAYSTDTLSSHPSNMHEHAECRAQVILGAVDRNLLQAESWQTHVHKLKPQSPLLFPGFFLLQSPCLAGLALPPSLLFQAWSIWHAGC